MSAQAKKPVTTPEPTLYDVMEMLVGMDSRITDMNSRMTDMNSYMTDMDSRLGRIEVTQRVVIERLDTVDERLYELDRKSVDMNVRLARVEDKVDDMGDTLHSLTHEVRGHERRISKLEKTVAA